MDWGERERESGRQRDQCLTAAQTARKIKCFSLLLGSSRCAGLVTLTTRKWSTTWCLCVCVTGRGGGQHFQTVKSIVLHLQTRNVCFQNKSRSALHSSSYFRHTIGKKPFRRMSQMVLSADDDDVRHVEPSSNFTRGCSRHSTISARSQQVIVQMCAGFVVSKSGLLPNTNFQCFRVFLIFYVQCIYLYWLIYFSEQDLRRGHI